MTMNTDYSDFLRSKQLVVPNAGREVDGSALNSNLFPFQRDLVRWALAKGRAALFCTTGTGKTLMQLSWAEHAASRVLILAPLAVAQQTVREGEKFGIAATYARSMDQAPPEGITITNYEMVEKFDADAFGAVVLDESSILKAYEGKTRTKLIETFRRTPLRLCCTATPAPNDIAEMANHAEFLGVMSRVEMLAAFFVHDDQGWRLKGHAREPFYRWLASWGMSLNRPSDLGYSDEGYDLPPLSIEPVIVGTDYVPVGRLFADRLKGVTERAQVRKQTVAERCHAAYQRVIAEDREPWIVWVGRNDEGEAMEEALYGDCVHIYGTLSPEEKIRRLELFLCQEARVLVTKPEISGWGLNLQLCARQVFVGLSDSYEAYFQCLRRCWRFGQTRPVKAYIVLTEPEAVIYDNVLAKEREARKMSEELVAHVSEFEKRELGQARRRQDYTPAKAMRLPGWLEESNGSRGAVDGR